MSEAIQEHFGYTRGYDQYDALRIFMEMMSQSGNKLRPLIKLHPKDTLEGYERFLSEYVELKPIIIRNKISPLESLQIADEVYGMTSIMLIEAYVLGKKVVSIQPGLKVMDPMVLSRLGYIQKIIESDSSEKAKTFARTDSPDQDFNFSFKEQAFLSFVNSLLAQQELNF